LEVEGDFQVTSEPHKLHLTFGLHVVSCPVKYSVVYSAYPGIELRNIFLSPLNYFLLFRAPLAPNPGDATAYLHVICSDLLLDRTSLRSHGSCTQLKHMFRPLPYL